MNLKNIFVCLFACIYLLFCRCISLSGDTIYLKNSDNGIPVETREMETDSITVAMPKKAVRSVTIAFNTSTDYPDGVLLKNNVKAPCKIVEMLEKDILVSFSRNWVKSLQMDFSNEKAVSRHRNYSGQSTERRIDDEEDENEDGEDDEMANKRSRDNFDQESFDDEPLDDRPLDLVMLEDELEEEYSEKKRPSYSARDDIKRELLSEIKNAKSNKGSGEEQQGSFDLLDKTLKSSNAFTKSDVEAENENNDHPQYSGMGKIKGRFLSKGNPLASCKVRLVKLRKEGLAYYKDTENTQPIEATTDRYGVYTFDNVPPGFHKLYWKPQTESSWIRRVSMEPDVLVKAGEAAYLDDVETDQRILN